MGEVNNFENKFKHKKVLVTGGSGFIGRHLIYSLLKSGANITATYFGDLGSSINQEINWKEINLSESESINMLVEEVQPQIVFHLAALLGSERSYEFAQKSIVTNVLGTHNLLSAIGTYSKNIEKIILMGSSEEYGNSKNIPYTEEHPTKPVSPYSVSKSSANQLALLYYELFQLPVVIIRPFIVYGPGQTNKMMIPQLIETTLKGKDFEMTLGEQTRDFIFVEDLIELILLSAISQNSTGEIFNACSGEEKSIREVAELIHKTMNATTKLLVGALPYRKNEIWRLYGSNEKAKKLLGWQPKTSLEEGLKKTILWYKNKFEERA